MIDSLHAAWTLTWERGFAQSRVSKKLMQSPWEVGRVAVAQSLMTVLVGRAEANIAKYKTLKGQHIQSAGPSVFAIGRSPD